MHFNSKLLTLSAVAKARHLHRR